MSRRSFVHSSKKVLHGFTVGTKIHLFCKPDNVMMVDDCEWKNVMNGNNSCFFLVPWKEKMHLPNWKNVVLNISIA